MSHYINTQDVVAVMIGDNWHPVDRESFDLDSYEFHDGGDLVHAGGKSGVCATGYGFTSRGAHFFGPLTAIQSVKMAKARASKAAK